MNKATQKLLCAQANKALGRALTQRPSSAYDVLLKRAMVDQLTASVPQKAQAASQMA